MIHKPALILVIILQLCTGIHSLAQVKLSGKTLKTDSISPIYGAHIINQTRLTGTVSNFNGSFSIGAESGDTLLFLALGFYNDTIIIPSKLRDDTPVIIVSLKERTYQLPTVDIFPFGTYAQFKEAFINFDYDEPSVDLQLPSLRGYTALPDGAGVVIPGPITFFYERFSRNAKNSQKLQYLTRNDELAVQAERIVNYDIIRQLTQLKDEKEIDDFLEFCNISKTFIVSQRKYIVYETLMACYAEYLILD